ncbi:MAG: DUF4416 family protein [Phycisphaeraceae bacterium]|nr:DUF4416 family protein [Phycisphaeraceae bacterium]
MWEIKEPARVKLIIGILAANDDCMARAVEAVAETFGAIDLTSDTWPFTQTHYYDQETGPSILRGFVTIDQPIHPGKLAQIKHQTNDIEKALAQSLSEYAIRPVNLDPGIIEPSKLVLASTKNFSHRIYIGQNMFAEITLIFDKGQWRFTPYTYPDYQTPHYLAFFSQVREKIKQQLISSTKSPTPKP